MLYARILIAFSLVISLIGCADMPPVTAKYYFPKAETTVAVTQTLACTAATDANKKSVQQELIVLQTVVPTTVYLRDESILPKEFSYNKASGWYRDADIAVSWNTYGGLTGLNSTITGEGGAIVKNAVSMASAVAAKPYIATIMFSTKTNLFKGRAAVNVASDVTTACNLISKYSSPAAGGSPPKTPTLTLTYSLAFYYFSNNGVSQQLQTSPTPIPVLTITSADQRPLVADPDDSGYIIIPADPDSDALLSTFPHNISNKLHYVLKATPAPVVNRLVSVKNDNNDSSDPRVWINDQADVTLDIHGPVGQSDGSLNVTDLWNSHVAVPLHTGYSLPVPKASIFGKLITNIALDNTGALTKLEYSETSGAADANAAAASMISAVNPTNAQKASDLQSQADLIYQQQRLASCQANNTTCSGK